MRDPPQIRGEGEEATRRSLPGSSASGIWVPLPCRGRRRRLFWPRRRCLLSPLLCGPAEAWLDVACAALFVAQEVGAA